MGNFNRGGGFGGKKRFDNDRGSFRGGDRGDRADRPTMHEAVCAECGKVCSVPFKPTGNKPVYCSNCFGKKEGGSSNRFERRDSARPSFAEKQMFEAVCDTCGKTCEVPFRPTGDKPVYCNDCFSKSEKGAARVSSGGSDQYKKQFEMLNAKLDDILKMLSPNKKSIEKETKIEKPVTKPVAKVVKKVAVVKKAAPVKKAVKKVVAKKKK